MSADWPTQPDRRTCGAAVLVVARDLPGPWEDFQRETLAMHRRVTGLRDTRGRPQVPWPRALGTPPWAVARQLGAREVRWIRTEPGRGYDDIAAATRDGHPVPVYVGSRWLPRHVVLALGEVASGLRCYEPARGRLVDVDRAAFADHRLGLAGWGHAWWSVLPARAS